MITNTQLSVSARGRAWDTCYKAFRNLLPKMHLSYVSCAWVSGDWVWNSSSVSHQGSVRPERKVNTAFLKYRLLQCSVHRFRMSVLMVYEKAWELAMEVWTADLKHKHEFRDSYKMKNYAAKQENVQCVSKHSSP